MTRTPVPGELLRAAIQPGVETAATSAQPWRATNAARGLSAIDREMLRLDARAWAAVEDAREHIRQAEADIAGAKDVLAALGTAETDEDITLALADYLAIDPAEVSFIGSMSDAVVAQIVITDDIVTENMIATGAVTADALNVVSTSGTGHSWRLDSTGLIAMHTASQAAMHLDSGGMRMWDTAGNLTVRVNGVQNLFTGSVRTVAPGGGRGVIIANTGQDQPGVWLTSTGGGGDSVPGLRLSVGATPEDDRLVIQGVAAMRYNNWRSGVVTGSVTYTGGAERNPGQLSWSVNRDAPVNISGASLIARSTGFYTITFMAVVSSRPGVTTRAFVQINRAAGAEARVPHSGENIATVTWTGWVNSGDRFDFIQYMDASGTYTLTSKIAALYHGV